MRVAIYARVSKALDQTPENQLIALREWAKNTNAEVIGEFVDESSSRDTRPQKELLLRKLRLGEIDGVAFWSLDRWGRTMSELILELEEFSRGEKKLISLKEGLDLSTAAGRLYANIVAAMANFERDRIKERTQLGLARARKQGKRLGRPPRIDKEKALAMSRAGNPYSTIAKEFGVSKAAICKALKRINNTPAVNPAPAPPETIPDNKTDVKLTEAAQ